MTIGRLRTVAAVIGGLTLAATAAGIAASPRAGAQAAGCSSAQVAVVVNFSLPPAPVGSPIGGWRDWPGGLVRGCQSWTSSLTDFTLLQQAGFSTAGDQRDGPGLVCRIGVGGGTQYPTPSEDRCITTPPANAYWGFWHASQGDTSWSYSQLGTMSYHPPKGSVDFWTFGAAGTDAASGGPPVSPQTVLPSGSPSPAPTAPAAGRSHPPAPAADPASAASPAAADAPRRRGASGPAGGQVPGAATGTSVPPAASPTSAPVEPLTAGAGAPRSGPLAITEIHVTGVPQPHSVRGSAVPTLVAIAIAAGIAAAAGLRYRRRAGRD